MKKILFIFLALISFSSLIAQETDEKPAAETGDIAFESSDKIFDKTIFMFNEGFSFVQVTRLQKQEKTSNFVWTDRMIGIYASVQTANFPLSDWYFRAQVLYPYQHIFNDMEVFAKQTVLYAFDFFFGMPFNFKSYKYVNINFIPGLHGMYQLSDEYHLGYFGTGAIVGFELPVSSRWTILLDGTFSVDYANLGGNSLMQPYDLAWSWQGSLGFRYSRAKLNTYSYLGHK